MLLQHICSLLFYVGARAAGYSGGGRLFAETKDHCGGRGRRRGDQLSGQRQTPNREGEECVQALASHEEECRLKLLRGRRPSSTGTSLDSRLALAGARWWRPAGMPPERDDEREQATDLPPVLHPWR